MANDYIIKIEGSWPSGETEYVIGTEDPQRLPVVSSDDNGDVLTVVDGKWSDAAPGGGGGGGGVLFVTTTSADGTTWTNANHTATEIVSALENGQLPVLYGVVAGSVPVAGYFATVVEGWALFYSQGNPKPLAVSSTGAVTVMP